MARHIKSPALETAIEDALRRLGNMDHPMNHVSAYSIGRESNSFQQITVTFMVDDEMANFGSQENEKEN